MAELRTPQGHALLLPEGGISVGADPENEVPVAAHLGLAPVHFRLQPWEGGHFIEDAGSGLGTLVNGHPVNWKPLVHGDAITAGELEVVYNQQATPAAGKAPIAIAPPVTVAAPPVHVFPVSPTPSSTPFPATAIGTVAPAPEMGEVPYAPVSPAWEPTAVATPPAWLPPDLLPEGYRLALPERSDNSSDTTARGVPEAPAEAAWLPSHPRPKTKRRLLPLAAVLTVLGGAALLGWQQGILPQWLKKNMGVGNPPTAGPIAQTKLSLPTPGPAPAPVAVQPPASQTAPTPAPPTVQTVPTVAPALPAPAPLPSATATLPPAPSRGGVTPLEVRKVNPLPAEPPVEIRAAIPVRK